ncbi:sodium-independent anion transporter [Peribacillus muralis]|uniref:Sodium-independent anion transporter n=1 Tax=Peribacillus muralis TaxID=264697 RepID=A0A1B3XLD3_9BACI|nr:solute carrier family 23 protein [Peribacillus muralis]AOH53992.1 sodium-independent anion transporter [Peribacillus muralis]
MIKDTRFRGYNMKGFQKDVTAGLVVGVVAIPLGLAFAIASGVEPIYGLYTTIIAGILISILGGSKYQIGGPTGAFVPLLFGIVMQYGYESLLIAGFLAGVILVLMGVLKLGNLMKFIPRPVIIGFTTGIAIIIFSGQIASFLGMKVEKHEAFIDNMKELVIKADTINLYSIVVACICFIVILLAPKVLPRVPGALLGLLVSTLAAFFLFPDKVATIGSTYGAIPKGFPEFNVPDLSLETIITLLPVAFTIALLGGVESLLSATVADNLGGTKHDSNKELVGQGIANMATPFFGGIPATGAIARTATNIKSGAVSPMSGVIHGIVVLLVLLVLAPFAEHIPLASMAPILMVVAWNMSERKEFAHVLKTKTTDSAVLVVTFLVTVFTDLIMGVGIGLMIAFVTFIKKMSHTLKVRERNDITEIIPTDDSSSKINVYNLEGPLFFGSIDVLESSILANLDNKTKILVLSMRRVTYMDTSAEAALLAIVNRIRKYKGKLIISGIQQQPKELLLSTGLYHKIEKQHFFKSKEDALYFAKKQLNGSADKVV